MANVRLLNVLVLIGVNFQVKEAHVQHAQNSRRAVQTVPQMVVDIFKDVGGDSWRHFSRWKGLL